MGPRGGGGGFGFLHMIGGLIGMALFFAVLLGLAALVYKIAVKKGWVKRHHRGPHGHRPEPGGPPQHHPGDALRILDERLARGEIEIADYQARRDALTGTGYPPFHQPPAPPAAPGQPPAGPPPTREEPQPPAS